MFDDADGGKGLASVNEKSIQLSLFGSFVSNDADIVSNTVAGWDAIPKYFFNAPMMKKLRGDGGLANSFLLEFKLKSIPCSIRIQPAQIVGSDGTEKAHFPGVSEELVEEALKKMMTEQGAASHNASKQETWVRFSLRGLHRELKSRGRQRNLTQIKESIAIMSGCIITLSVEGKETWKGSILQDLITVGRQDYRDDTDSLHIARLPLPLSHGINQLEYRQFNYKRYMSLDDPLSRWMFRQMAARYVNANSINDYPFMYSNLLESGHLQGQGRSNRRKVINALEELKSKGAISHYAVADKVLKRKIVDVKYMIKPSPSFISEQKAAHKRDRLNRDKMKMAAIRR